MFPREYSDRNGGGAQPHQIWIHLREKGDGHVTPPWRHPVANRWFLLSTPIQMLPPGGSICGRLTQYLPMGCLQGGSTKHPSFRGSRKAHNLFWPIAIATFEAPSPIRYGYTRQHFGGGV